MRRFCGLFLLASFVLAGCQGELHEVPGNLQLKVGLHESGLEVLESAEVGELPNPPVVADAVRFTFRPADGAPEVEGTVRDGRVLRSEFDETGQPDPRRLVADAGVFDVRVPAVPGRLELRTGTGELLGEVDVDPTRPTTRTQALMREADILGDAVKIVDHGDSSRKADLLFLPEGYSESEMGDFHAHVDAIVAQMATHSGYREHWDGFNVWRQDVRSRTRGTGAGGRSVDTAFETAAGVSGLERCVFFTNPAGIQAARRLATQAGADATVVLVNSTSHGGCAGDGVVVSARPRWVADVVSHELGHALFGLADEYETSRPGGFCTTGPNVATSSNAESLPWADMLTTSELPTPPTASFGTVGAFEGGGYCSRGRYRPTHNCMMRTLGTPMCPVCRREVARSMAGLAPADSTDGSAIDVTNKTGAGIWVRCDGQIRSGCSDWTWVLDEETATIRAAGGKLILHNIDIPAPVLFDFMRVTAPSDDVTLFANLSDPFSPTTSPGSSTTTASVVAPTGLAPDLTVVRDRQVQLVWDDVPAADAYELTVDVEEGAGWRLYDGRQTARPGATVMLAATDARYRWKVAACGAAGCVSSLHALFSTELPTTDPTDSDEPGTQSTVAPETPAGLFPAHETAVDGAMVRLSWDAQNASGYNVFVRVFDAGTGSWVDSVSRSNHTSTGLDAALTVPGTWYVWSVQACNDYGCSAWSEQLQFYANP